MSAPITLEELTTRAAAGDAQAQYSLAAALARAGRREEADRWLNAAAHGGEPEALFTLATRQMHTRAGAIAVAPRLADAAAKGSPSAARLAAVLRAMGLGFDRDDAAALDSVAGLAARGFAPMQREIAALFTLQYPDDKAGAAAFADPRSLDWAGLARRLALAPARAPARERLCASPDVVLYRDAVAPPVCAYVIAHALTRLGPALVYDPRGAGMMRDPLRSSATASLGPLDLDLALIAVNRRLSSLAGLADDQGEFLSVMRYRPGEQYRPHFDNVPPGPDFDRNGQRIKTALLYLNDDYEGGETAFLAPDLKVRGRVGDVVVFSNVTADGRGDPASRHAGLPVRSGEKWLASKWFRERNFDF